MQKIEIIFPPETHSLLEATALANGTRPEEIIVAAIRCFLQKQREEQGHR
jgi:hypothetical protein